MSTVACIPAFNEEKVITDVVKRTLDYVNKVIVCDDGSNDNTSKKAKEAGAYVIKHEKNLGKGAALKTLFEHVLKLDADIVVTIDGDGQFLPEEIPKLINKLKKTNTDIVIGYRFDDKTEMPYYRQIGNKFLDKVANLGSTIHLRDTQSGFRVYSKKALQKIKFVNDGFGVDAEIVLDASNKGLKISEEKVKVIYNTGEKTSTKNPISHTSDVLSSLIELVAIRKPLRYLGIPGLILLVIGIVYSSVVIVIFNETRYFSIPSTLVSLGTLVIGLMLVLMSAVLFSISRAMRKLY